MKSTDAQNTVRKKLLVSVNRTRISIYADAVRTVQQKLRLEWLYDDHRRECPSNNNNNLMFCKLYPFRLEKSVCTTIFINLKTRVKEHDTEKNEKVFVHS